MEYKIIKNESKIKPKSAYILTDDTIYQVVIDLENRYYKEDIHTFETGFILFLNEENDENLTVIEFDLSEDITDIDKYDFICNSHIMKEKEQIIFTIYPFEEDEVRYLQKINFK